MATQANPIEVQKFLKDANYPMQRDELVTLAEGNGTTEEILDLLESLPDVDFESATDVQEAFGIEERREKPKKTQMTSRASRKQKIEDRKKQLKEETGKLTEPGKTVTGEPDHRLKGQETEALKSARHMEHGYDGRGQITDPEMDARLAENRAKAEEAQTEKRHTWREYSNKK
jgi:hypothetical protein